MQNVDIRRLIPKSAKFTCYTQVITNTQDSIIVNMGKDL